jgi:BCD family chlorophyll transporter-like MFS transporter
LFSHGTLTATMNLAPPEQAGLALGAWGAVQATTAGVAVALGGILRDLVSAASVAQGHGPAGGYIVVYSLEVLLLLVTLAVMAPLVRRPRLALEPLTGDPLPSPAAPAGPAAAGPRGAA